MNTNTMFICYRLPYNFELYIVSVTGITVNTGAELMPKSIFDHTKLLSIRI